MKGDHADASRGPGLFLALLATAGIAYGGRRGLAHRPPLSDYSYCSAANGSSRAARRAGTIAASTPGDGGDDGERDQRADRDREAQPLAAQRRGGERGQEQPDGDAERGADQRGDHALVADHAAHLAAAHADRPQHPQLARALEAPRAPAC